MNITRLGIAVVTATVWVLLSGCVSTGAKAPGEASTAEILFGDNVQQYLAQRREHLDSLKHKMVSLDEETLEMLGSLHALDAQLAAVKPGAEKSRAEIAALRKDVESRKRELESNMAKAQRLKQRVDTVSANIEQVKQNQVADKQQISELDAEAEELEAQTAIINRSINRTLNLKAEQLLRQGS